MSHGRRLKMEFSIILDLQLLFSTTDSTTHLLKSERRISQKRNLRTKNIFDVSIWGGHREWRKNFLNRQQSRRKAKEVVEVDTKTMVWLLSVCEQDGLLEIEIRKACMEEWVRHVFPFFLAILSFVLDMQTL
ncbi:hypothetical protein ACHQM5_022062 [Ranunculus cassubicifolius]